MTSNALINIMTTANSLGVNLNDYLLYLIIVALGETLTLQQLQIISKNEGIDLKNYLTYKWELLT